MDEQDEKRMIEAGAQALADDCWHPPQPLSSLSRHDQERFRRQARLVLAAVEVVGFAE